MFGENMMGVCAIERIQCDIRCKMVVFTCDVSASEKCKVQRGSHQWVRQLCRIEDCLREFTSYWRNECKNKEILRMCVCF